MSELSIAKIGSFGVCQGTDCAVVQTLNVPMRVAIKLFLKCEVGKILKQMRWLMCRQTGQVCVELQRNCQPSFCHPKVSLEVKVWSFWCPLNGCTVVF